MVGYNNYISYHFGRRTVMEAKSKVLEYINSNFNMAKVKLRDFPRLPGGTLVIDELRNVLIFAYDSLNDRVLISRPGGTGFKAAV
jgi:hypothetical protein